MRTILAIAIIIGTGVVANAHPAQPQAHGFRAMFDQQQPIAARVYDGSGYYGQGSRSGGPAGGLPNRN